MAIVKPSQGNKTSFYNFNIILYFLQLCVINKWDLVHCKIDSKFSSRSKGAILL